eukprot:64816-Hanusia_phi.AAC.1
MISSSIRQQVRRKDFFINVKKIAFSVTSDSSCPAASMHCLVKIESDGSDCLRNILEAKRKDHVAHDDAPRVPAQGQLKSAASLGSSAFRIASE